ncbi:aromatase/cyclase [Streptomyces sp. NPDC054766]|uniref:aromatase/cyclase n=1 Tax=Streptomyces rhizosphaerihabitans TaxID=1266770 RepID=UPI0021BEF154|nr:SRPBCC family protein [Streptomyces rhizosphaerihabitans]MCT9011748.1 SRPBCC family protein [Streptomyces rhizosphaerihabitans]
MPSQRGHCAQESASVAAPAGVVYGLLADAPRWPVLLPGIVHAERIDFDGARESLRLWQLRHGQVHGVLARRVLLPSGRRIEFELQDAVLPGAPVSGSWSVAPDGAGCCLLTLRQEHPAGTGGPPGALDAQVRAELSAVRAAAERWERLDELLLSFEDSVYVNGAPEVVYDFLYRIGDWAELVPHVERAEVTEDRPGVQTTVLHTCAPGTGRPLVSEGVRLCFPAAGRIVHKETVSPDPLAAHCTEWSLEPDASGVRVVCAHHVMLRQNTVEAVLGKGALLVDARRHVRQWLGRSSTETLDLARWHAESAVRRLR